jgi:hypothetical protein
MTKAEALILGRDHQSESQLNETWFGFSGARPALGAQHHTLCKRRARGDPSVYDAMQGITGVQLNILQRLAQVQQDVVNQAVEATNDQFHLISQIRDPREFASAQSDLAKRHGQRYVDIVKQAVDIIAEGWQEYGDRLEKAATTATSNAQRAARKTA